VIVYTNVRSTLGDSQPHRPLRSKTPQVNTLDPNFVRHNRQHSRHGRVPRHVDATRVPSKLGVRTAGAVYDFAGDWRTVMFDIECPNVSPLHSLT
jgi:hypothetical protein